MRLEEKLGERLTQFMTMLKEMQSSGAFDPSAVDVKIKVKVKVKRMDSKMQQQLISAGLEVPDSDIMARDEVSWLPWASGWVRLAYVDNLTALEGVEFVDFDLIMRPAGEPMKPAGEPMRPAGEPK